MVTADSTAASIITTSVTGFKPMRCSPPVIYFFIKKNYILGGLRKSFHHLVVTKNFV